MKQIRLKERNACHLWRWCIFTAHKWRLKKYTHTHIYLCLSVEAHCCIFLTMTDRSQCNSRNVGKTAYRDVRCIDTFFLQLLHIMIVSNSNPGYSGFSLPADHFNAIVFIFWPCRDVSSLPLPVAVFTCVTKTGVLSLDRFVKDIKTDLSATSLRNPTQRKGEFLVAHVLDIL